MSPEPGPASSPLRHLVFLLFCAAALALLFSSFELWGFWGRWDRHLSDAFFSFRGFRPLADRIAVVGITEACLMSEARWPWSHAALEKLLREISKGKPDAIVFTVPLALEDKLDPTGTFRFSKAVREAGNVFFAVDVQDRVRLTGHLRQLADLRLPVARLRKACRGYGLIEGPDFDMGRWSDHLPERRVVEGETVASLSDVVSARLGLSPPEDQLLVDHPGPLERVTRLLPAEEVMKGKINPRYFAGKVVVVGGAAPGLFVHRETPFGPASRLEYVTALMETVVLRRGVRRLPFVTSWCFLLLLTIPAVCLGSKPRLGQLFLFCVVAFFAWSVLSLWGFVTFGLLFPTLSGYMLLVVASLGGSGFRAWKMKERLNRAEALSGQVFDALPLAVLVFDDRFGFLLRNEGEPRFEGRSFEAGLSPDALFPDWPAFLEACRRYRDARTGKVQTEELLLEGSGEPRWIRCSWLPLRNQGKAFGHVCLLVDVSEIRQAQQSLARKNQWASLGRFASGIVHEVKNPLHNLRLALETLRESLTEDEDLEIVDALRDEITRLVTLLNEILSYARPGDDTVREAVDLAEVFASIETLVATSLRRAGIRLEITDLGAAPPVMARADRLRQVFLNLIDNARCAMGDRGRIRISLLRPKQGREFELRVDDDGPGVPPDLRDRLFEPFVSGHGDGTGLGLYLAATYLAEIDGRIQVEDGADGGTCVRVIFPLPGEEPPM